jgi:hypothetical protein
MTTFFPKQETQVFDNSLHKWKNLKKKKFFVSHKRNLRICMHDSYNLCVTFSCHSSQWKIDMCNMMTFDNTFLSYCIYYPKTTYYGGSSHALRASQLVLIAKIFFTSKFSYVVFCNPTNKTKIGIANSGGLLIVNHMD